jgi:predicted MFS family arabinose efflux permease
VSARDRSAGEFASRLGLAAGLPVGAAILGEFGWLGVWVFTAFVVVFAFVLLTVSVWHDVKAELAERMTTQNF